MTRNPPLGQGRPFPDASDFLYFPQFLIQLNYKQVDDDESREESGRLRLPPPISL